MTDKFIQNSDKSVQIADLDALISEKKFFKLHGKTFSINPVTTENYLKFIHGLSKFEKAQLEKQESPKEVIDIVIGLLNPLIPEISEDDLMKCTQAQIGALVSLVIDSVQGRVSEKKK